MMKKILYLLVALLPLWCVSCSDDDDDEPGKTKDGKRLVAKITEVDHYNRIETIFEYDKNARLEKVVEKSYYEDELEDEISIIFSYSSDKIVGKMTEKWEGKIGNHTATFILNGQGYISEYEIKWSPLEDEGGIENGTFIYNDKGQLVGANLIEGEGVDVTNFEYSWVNDELVKEVEDGRYVSNYSYSDKENKTNIDFYYYLGGMEFGLDCVGYLGQATSKYLPEELDGEEVSYKFDGERCPIEISYDGYTYTVEYK